MRLADRDDFAIVSESPLRDRIRVADSDFTTVSESPTWTTSYPNHRLGLHDRIRVTDLDDFASESPTRMNAPQDGVLCDKRGQLGPREFEDVMRRQLRQLIQVVYTHPDAKNTQYV